MSINHHDNGSLREGCSFDVLSRRSLLVLGMVGAPLVMRSISVRAQPVAFPSKTITVICPYAAGATTDLISRLFAKTLAEEIGANVIVENRPGAGGNIGSAAAAKADPDGHTILLGAMGPLAVNSSLYAQIGFDPIADLAPLGLVASVPLALVVPSNSKFATLADLIHAIRTDRAGFSYASAGTGTPMHLAGELFAAKASLNLTHIAYRGSAPAINDVISNHVPFMFDALVSVLPHIKGGTLRVLATTADSPRPTLLSDVPTLKEAGFDVAVSGWYGFLVPVKTPPLVQEKLVGALARIVARDDVRKQLTLLGSDPVDPAPTVFSALIKSEAAKWQSLIRSTGIKAE